MPTFGKYLNISNGLACSAQGFICFVQSTSSWLNAVEGFFAKLTRRRLKHGVFYSLVDLQAAINRFIKEYNANDARPFIWTADPDKIIAARNRGFQTLESIH